MTKSIKRSLLAGLAVATTLAVTTPAAIAKTDPPKKHCIVVLGIQICLKGGGGLGGLGGL
jgi:hypothetical protein